MKVSELIEILSKQDQDKSICVVCPCSEYPVEGHIQDIELIREQEIYVDANKNDDKEIAICIVGDGL